MDKCNSIESLSEIIKIEKSDAYSAIGKMMQFLHDPKMKNLSHIAIINGHFGEFFSNRTYYHLVDVKNIFIFCLDTSVSLSKIAFIILGIFALTKNINKLYKIWIKTLVASLVVVTSLSIIVSMNFSECFVIFHKILFTNDLWLLNPYEDYLINLLPEKFFAIYAICIIIIFVIFCFVFSFSLKTLSRLEAKSDL